MRSKITKREIEINTLKNEKLQLTAKIKKLENNKRKDSDYIKLQEEEINNLQKKLKNGKSLENDEEKEQLKISLQKVVEVKLKYEKILKALVDKPGIN